MRILLKENLDSEVLLDELVRSCFTVLEGSIATGRADDIQMGVYVALRRVLGNSLVKCRACGTLESCEDMLEEAPFATTEQPVLAARWD
jgi:hypothetical protein